jgi:hypothetical protein
MMMSRGLVGGGGAMMVLAGGVAIARHGASLWLSRWLRFGRHSSPRLQRRCAGWVPRSRREIAIPLRNRRTSALRMPCDQSTLPP